MQELNIKEVEEVTGGASKLSGFMYYLMTGDIQFKTDDGGTAVFSFR